jgi:hypothetical protein
VTRRRFVMETFCSGGVLFGDVLSRRRSVCAPFFFHQTTSPGPIRLVKIGIQILLDISGVICIRYYCKSLVNSSPGEPKLGSRPNKLRKTF